jgi:hypothetical protein
MAQAARLCNSSPFMLAVCSYIVLLTLFLQEGQTPFGTNIIGPLEWPEREHLKGKRRYF